MRLPDRDAIGELLDWTPRHGILSVYLRFEPEDRGEGWRIQLRNELDRVAEGVRSERERESRLALEETARRVLDRFPAQQPHPEGRAQIGFVEVARDRGAAERWFQAQLPPPRTEVLYNHRPYLVPLVALLDDGAARGVLLVSSERARLLEWNLGMIEELESWELEIFSLDWRERKAQRSADPGAGQGASASGRDQHDQRLDANRERFLGEVGKRARARVARVAGRGQARAGARGDRGRRAGARDPAGRRARPDLDAAARGRAATSRSATRRLGAPTDRWGWTKPSRRSRKAASSTSSSTPSATTPPTRPPSRPPTARRSPWPSA